MADGYIDKLTETGKKALDTASEGVQSVVKLFGAKKDSGEVKTFDEFKKKFGTTVDGVKDLGGQVWNDAGNFVEKYGPEAKEGLGNSMGTLLGGLIMGGLAMFGLDMGFMGTLLMFALGAIIGAFIDGEHGVLGGLVKSITGHGKDKDKDKTPGKIIELDKSGKSTVFMLDKEGKPVQKVEEASLILQGHTEIVEGKNRFVAEAMTYAVSKDGKTFAIPVNEQGNVLLMEPKKGVSLELDAASQLVVTPEIKAEIDKIYKTPEPPKPADKSAAAKPETAKPEKSALLALDDNNHLVPLAQASLIVQGRYTDKGFVIDKAAAKDKNGDFNRDAKGNLVSISITNAPLLPVKNGELDLTDALTAKSITILRTVGALNKSSVDATEYFKGKDGRTSSAAPAEKLQELASAFHQGLGKDALGKNAPMTGRANDGGIVIG
jgi:hypothetical protein